MTNHQIRIARYLASRGIEVKHLAPKFGVRERTLQQHLRSSMYPSGVTGVLTRAEAEAYAEQLEVLAAQ